jgi:hypothetical protein
VILNYKALIRSKVVGVGQMRASHAAVVAGRVGVHEVVEKLYREVMLIR